MRPAKTLATPTRDAPPSFLHHNLIAYNIPTVGGTPRDLGTYDRQSDNWFCRGV